MGEQIDSFRALRVYKTAFELQQDIYRLSRKFPREEKFSLVDQIRRSSRSIGSNIAEAWQKRRYEPHFVSKLSDADGEQAETQHWLSTSIACEYADEDTINPLIGRCLEIGRMLGKMMNEPEKWCGRFHRTRDEQPS